MTQIRLCVEITLLGPFLTNASSAGKLGVDNAAATLPDERCFLPFSLIKGRLRQSWDELGFPHGDEWFGSRLGGWDATRGRLRFSDFSELPSAARPAGAGRTERRHRIRIDEDTGAADDGALQVIESPFRPGQEAVFTGEISFFTTEADRKTIVRRLELAFGWTPAFGAGRTIGFGRVKAVAIVERGTGATYTVDSGAERYDYSITLRDPFCLARRRVSENLFETDEVIPGSAVRGVAATTLNEVLGRRSSEVIDGTATADPSWAALATHFNAIAFTHAFPSCGERPVEPPLSIVRSEAGDFPDVALQEGPVLIGGAAPQFSIDWKGDAYRRLRASYQWPDLQPNKEIRVRTAIDRATRRAADQQLFSYEMIRPGEGLTWRGSADFSAVPEAERPAVITQLQALFAHEPAAWGKTKARGGLSLTPAAAIDRERLTKEPWVVTLQTPALLCDSALLDETSGGDELFAAYAAAWHDMSGGRLRLVRFFAQQSLAGGYLVHRFRAGERYAPFLLTSPGSVFVLEATDPNVPNAISFVESIARRGLPLPSWALKRYTADWRRNPFLPVDGFGEVTVNLDCHRQPIVDCQLIERWTPQWRPVTDVLLPSGGEAALDVTPSTTRTRIEDTASGTPRVVLFERRWTFGTTLTTTSDLHIGSGEMLAQRLTRLDVQKNVVVVEVSGVAVDSQNRVYIPGSALKGALRSWLVRQLPDSRSMIEGLFGMGGVPETATGGKVEVHDAHALASQPLMANVPSWDESRRTGVTASAAIDRRTRTAQDEKLFHREYVPPGVLFEVRLSGDGLSPDEAALLVFGLQAFNADPAIRLGAETREGWGAFTASPVTIESIGAREWLANASSWNDETASVVAAAAKLVQRDARARLRIPLTVNFTGPFLVNEPSRTKDVQVGAEEKEKLPNHAERVGTNGNVVLPVSSFRGAIRTRAEKIVRTLGGRACAATDPADACKAIDDAAQADQLCLACQLFGAPGWATPITFDGFRLTNDPKRFEQELVAIDRFTGGVSGSAKFNVQAVWKPAFQSALTVDLTRWEKGMLPAARRDAAIGLLLLTLRDLADGDMTLGFGASKGYGACEATVEWPAAAAAGFVQAFVALIGPPRTEAKPQEHVGANTELVRIANSAPDPPVSGTPQFHNPYTFVPLSTTLGPHSKTDQPSAYATHAEYVVEGLSGRLLCRLTTLTPIVIGAAQDGVEGKPKTVMPFSDPDAPSQPAIPSTSLRGLISSLAEAASNSSLRVLEEKEYEVRAEGKKRTVDGTSHDFVARVSPELLPFNENRSVLTIAEELFGYVDAGGSSNARALASRLRFSMGTLRRMSQAPSAYLPAAELKILSSPKPPSPAMYFTPNERDGYVGKANLTVRLHRPRGRKMYLHHPIGWTESPWVTRSSENANQKVIVTPVIKGAQFFFHVDFENLSSIEFGLLAYALRPTDTFAHKLGMGKSLGLGSVRIDPLAVFLTDPKTRYSSWETPRHAGGRVIHSYQDEWASPEEQARLETVKTTNVDFSACREVFRSQMQSEIRQAIETIGDPHSVRYPVHVPQLLDKDLEAETFRWFVKNDSGRVLPQYLASVSGPSIPPLSREFAKAVESPRKDSRTTGPRARPTPSGANIPVAQPINPLVVGEVFVWPDSPLSHDRDRGRIMATAQGGRRAFADAGDPRFADVLLEITAGGQAKRTVTVRAIDKMRFTLMEVHPK